MYYRAMSLQLLAKTQSTPTKINHNQQHHLHRRRQYHRGIAESEDQNRIRFQVELEFYWREPEYARYLKYPMCLHFLELLQHEAFRRECVSTQVCKFMDDQAILLWQHYTRRRTRTLQPPDAPALPAPPAPPLQVPRQQP
ncbi:Mediator complex subunit 31 [Operophtera brumata]|uniref:Mediator of RNA polymerase II transcription subunit 31 n=1 Tax=Operophtera brumata TaxID=104452 RepID=A0A0L7LSW6_OPEBR|nr:Mediator complex subunit 31 [Operophtera brumata]